MTTYLTGSHDDFWKWFHSTWWSPMKDNQNKARVEFEKLLEETIRDLWKPGHKYNSAAVVMVDFSVEDQITLHVYEKASGHPSDMTGGSNLELLRKQRMWGHLKVTEEYGVKIRSFELIQDPAHSYTVFSSNHIESKTFPVHAGKLRTIKWMYQEAHPYIT